jgi:hypothetical protein
MPPPAKADSSPTPRTQRLRLSATRVALK